MKIFKHSMKIIAIAIFATLISCGDEYPDLEDGLYAEFITSMGTMVVKLHYDKTPVTVANFVLLAEGNHPMVDSVFKGKRFYNGLTFHRVMNNFMIQGGDPTGTGSGNPGYRFGDEFDETLKLDKPGILSMANSGPGTNGSQFFITEQPTPWLENIHTVFGEVVLGLDVQDSISNVIVDPRNKPLKDIVIKEVNIIRKGFDARNFDALKTWETELPKLEGKKNKKEEEAKAKGKIAAEAFIKENENLKKGTVKSLPSGLVMVFTHESNGKTPKATEKVLISYAGFLENGELFDTNWKEVAIKHGKYNKERDQKNRYTPFSMIYNEQARLVPGFREAMLNMNVGDKARVFIPSYLGYGVTGYGMIQPNTDLIFDIEIIGIEK